MSHWTKCSVATCIRPSRYRGLCDAHWSRLKTGGKLQEDVPIGPPPAKNRSRARTKQARTPGGNSDLRHCAPQHSVWHVFHVELFRY